MLLNDRQYQVKYANAPFITSSAQAYPAGLNRYFAVKLATKARQVEANKMHNEKLVKVGFWRNTLVRHHDARDQVELQALLGQ